MQVVVIVVVVFKTSFVIILEKIEIHNLLCLCPKQWPHQCADLIQEQVRIDIITLSTIAKTHTQKTKQKNFCNSHFIDHCIYALHVTVTNLQYGLLHTDPSL